MSTNSKTQIMGILNVTPDSFYDGGKVVDPVGARRRSEIMIKEGADWIDIGGESSRPGAKPVGVQEELKRVLPALEAVRDLKVSISVDTYRAETARKALDLGEASADCLGHK